MSNVPTLWSDVISSVRDSQEYSLHTIFGDDDLIKRIYPDNAVKILFSEDFMNKSKDFYGALPWLGRELIQNFIDANPHDRWTLNGVHIDTQTTADANILRISWNRSFPNPTALYKLDSGKSKSDGLAGGNGIGLKQTVLILFRDYGIQKFTIQGDGWTLDYDFLTAEQINKALTAHGIDQHVGKWWLVAHVNKDIARDTNSYEIVMDRNKDHVFAWLEHIADYGVHTNNPFLQNMDYVFPGLGGLKLLPDIHSMGWFFLNGQRFRCKLDSFQEIKKQVGEEMGSSPYSAEELYRWWPSGISLYVNANYSMSIDRHPLGTQNVQSFIDLFIDRMSADQIKDVFAKTFWVWTTLIQKTPTHIPKHYEYAYWYESTPVIEHFVYELVNRIHTDETLWPHINDIFLDLGLKKERLVAVDHSDTTALQKLSSTGYTLVPEYFKKLWIQSATLFLDDTSGGISPDDIKQQQEKQAMTTWVVSSYTSFDPHDFHTQKDFLSYLMHALGRTNISYSDDAQKISLNFYDGKYNKLEKKDLYAINAMPAMQDIRWLYVLGKEKGYFDSFSLYFENTKADLHFHNDELFIKLYPTGDLYYDKLTLIIWSETLSDSLINDCKRRRWVSRVSKKIIEPTQRIVSRLLFGMILVGSLWGVGHVVKSFRNTGSIGFVHNLQDLHNLHALSWDGRLDDIKRTIYNEKNIASIVGKYEQSAIPLGSISKQILDGFSHTNAADNAHIREHPVENFSIVSDISDIDKQKLGLLKAYVELTLHIPVDNHLYLFDGNWTKWLNTWWSYIGLHRSMMNADFFEALKTFVHEVAHNHAMNHGEDFIRANSALHTAILENQTDLIRRIMNWDTNISKEESFILTADMYWDQLK